MCADHSCNWWNDIMHTPSYYVCMHIEKITYIIYKAMNRNFILTVNVIGRTMIAHDVDLLHSVRPRGEDGLGCWRLSVFSWYNMQVSSGLCLD